MKSEEKSIQAISAQAHGEAADNRLLRKKLRARDKRVEELEAMVSNLNKQLSEKIEQLNDMMQKLVFFMTGNGEVSLSESLREAVVAGVRAEFEARLDKLEKNLEKEEDPELLKAVKYALVEYPCMLRCLEDGNLDFSNNICERQIRRIAKYRTVILLAVQSQACVLLA